MKKSEIQRKWDQVKEKIRIHSDRPGKHDFIKQVPYEWRQHTGSVRQRYGVIQREVEQRYLDFELR